eukprot:354422-Chlamydomonas_euryale.AAC.6
MGNSWHRTSAISHRPMCICLQSSALHTKSSHFRAPHTSPLEQAEALTAACTRLQLSVAISYGARSDLASAARAVAKRVAAGELDPEQARLEGRNVLFSGSETLNGVPSFLGFVCYANPNTRRDKLLPE